MSRFDDILKGGDLRSTGRSGQVVAMVKTQADFDDLIQGLYSADRAIVMRTADAVEKITRVYPVYLHNHKEDIIKLCETAAHKELKWHLALLVPRLPLSEKEFGVAWKMLINWVADKKESRIVRVNSLQAVFDLLPNRPELASDFGSMLHLLENENIPSINARIRKLK